MTRENSNRPEWDRPEWDRPELDRPETDRPRSLTAYLTLLLLLGAGVADASPQSAPACSYDGSALRVSQAAMRASGNRDAERVVAEILRHTGLPQNFEVTAGDVPNAAAVILRGPDGLPQRVIAYNPVFMQQVLGATAQNDWAPISIMAHEVGHHLAGHTILPGGSQPPTELEADKFSGFVLYKMGAPLDDAVIAMKTLVPDTPSATHPRRSLRVGAIQNGWQEACRQQGADCSGGVAGAAASTPSTTGSATRSAPAPAPSAPSLPTPDPAAIPGKFDRFVVDEVGILDPEVARQLAADLYAHAEQHDVEIVVLITGDLEGLGAEDYAYRMMRLLRVGKLEVGNGAVLVLAPQEGEVGVALGSGLGSELGERVGLIESTLRSFLENHDRCSSCARTWSASVARAADQIVRDTKSWEWVVRYPDLASLLAADQEEKQQRRAGSGPSSPLDSATWRKLVRVEGRLAATPTSEASGRIVSSRVPEGGAALELRTEDGASLVVYVDPHVEAIMPTELVPGELYSMVLRESNLHLRNFDLVSFDRR